MSAHTYTYRYIDNYGFFFTRQRITDENGHSAYEFQLCDCSTSEDEGEILYSLRVVEGEGLNGTRLYMVVPSFIKVGRWQSEEAGAIGKLWDIAARWCRKRNKILEKRKQR